MLQRNVRLAEFSNMKIGGPADYFFDFKSKEDLLAALQEYRAINPQMNNIFILGGGTNILFNDEGYRGLVLKDSIDFIQKENDTVSAGSGTLVSKLLDFCIQDSLSGLEWAGGLPGTVGGAVRGNAGAYGGETKDAVLEVETIQIANGQIKKRSNKECLFGYRQSIFKTAEGKGEIVLSATFELKAGDQSEIKAGIQEKIDHRNERHPMDMPNLGSTFKNILLENVPSVIAEKYKTSIKSDPFPIFPSTKLLAEAGLSGKAIGGAKFSEKHPNFIVNFNNAKASDVLELIEFAKKEIQQKFGVSLEEEIMLM